MVSDLAQDNFPRWAIIHWDVPAREEMPPVRITGYAGYDGPGAGRRAVAGHDQGGVCRNSRIRRRRRCEVAALGRSWPRRPPQSLGRHRGGDVLRWAWLPHDAAAAGGQVPGCRRAPPVAAPSAGEIGPAGLDRGDSGWPGAAVQLRGVRRPFYGVDSPGQRGHPFPRPDAGVRPRRPPSGQPRRGQPGRGLRVVSQQIPLGIVERSTAPAGSPGCGRARSRTR